MKAGAFSSRARPKSVREVVYKEELAADKTLRDGSEPYSTLYMYTFLTS